MNRRSLRANLDRFMAQFCARYPRVVAACEIVVALATPVLKVGGWLLSRVLVLGYLSCLSLLWLCTIPRENLGMVQSHKVLPPMEEMSTASAPHSPSIGLNLTPVEPVARQSFSRRFAFPNEDVNV